MKQTFTIRDFLPIDTPISLKIDIKDRFRLRRSELKLSRLELSKRSGVSYGSIRRFESTGDISFFSLLKMSQAMDLLEEFSQLFSHPIITSLKDLK